MEKKLSEYLSSKTQPLQWLISFTPTEPGQPALSYLNMRNFDHSFLSDQAGGGGGGCEVVGGGSIVNTTDHMLQ